MFNFFKRKKKGTKFTIERGDVFKVKTTDPFEEVYLRILDVKRDWVKYKYLHFGRTQVHYNDNSTTTTAKNLLKRCSFIEKHTTYPDFERKIVIYLDEADEFSLPYNDVKRGLLDRKRELYTYCLDFFNFEYLKKDYEVILQGKSGVIILSELLENPKKFLNSKYTDELITEDSDVQTMLKDGKLKFAPRMRYEL